MAQELQSMRTEEAELQKRFAEIDGIVQSDDYPRMGLQERCLVVEQRNSMSSYLLALRGRIGLMTPNA